MARTWEHWWHGNECSRHGDERLEREGLQVNCAPQLAYPNFFAQASTEANGPWDSNYLLEDNFSWFVPGKKGDHDVKFGARYNYTELRRVSQINQNGTFVFNNDLAFDAANPRTYPERLQIRMGEFEEFINNHTLELYVQDKWKMGGRTTLSGGIRYDLELIPLNETDNPLFPAGDKNYPVDKNNFSPRIGLTHSLDDQGKSVIRGGYGLFYNRTILGAIDDTIEQGKYLNSVTGINFPNDSADPGPAAGRLPTDPLLFPVVVNGQLLVNRALLNQLYPPGALYRNTGAVVFDSPDRKQPLAHQATIGYARELSATIAINADFIHTANRDMFLARNLNPMVRANTSRTGPITRVDAFGVLGEPYSQQVWVMENTGHSDYNALNLSLEKRYANSWSGRISYSLSKSRGNGRESERHEHLPGPDRPQPG